MSGPDSAALEAQRRWLAHRRAGGGESDFAVGVAASFTAEPLEPHLGVHLLDAGLTPSFVFADYNQIYQVCLDPGGLGSLDALVLLWRLEDQFAPAVPAAADGDAEAAADVVSGAASLGAAVASLAGGVGYPVVVSLPPYPAPIGADIADSVTALRLTRLHGDAVAAFVDAVGSAPVRYADLHAWLATYGVERAHDQVKALAYKQPYTSGFWNRIGAHVGDILLRERRPAPKCIALDCDNTLWGGVIGEDGIGGIELSSAFPGSAFKEFQRVLVSLRRRGVLLAICSKNNPQEVHDVFAQHDDMVLSADDIAVWRLNWEPKSANLREIAAELNIGADSDVLIDDSHYEIAEVASAAPEVLRLQVPDEVALLPDLIASSGLFRNLQVSEEDRKRGEMIRQEVSRRQAQSTMSREEFLKSLELTVDFIDVADEHVGRVAQLTNKTNQFNLTTVRRSEAEIRALVGSPDHLVRAIRVADKFGDYGLVGVAIVRMDGSDAHVDTFLMSCRVLGRGIETAFLSRVARDAANAGAKRITGEYRPTAKNMQVADFYPRHGFAANDAGGFVTDIVDVPAVPDHISCS